MGEKGPLKNTASCREAVAAYDNNDLNGALEAIRNCKAVYEHSFLYHHAEGFLLYKLASQSSEIDAVHKYLEDAAVSARKAWMLCGDNLLMGHFCASLLYLLSRFNQDYDGVFEVCRQALAIKEPKEPDTGLFFIKDSYKNLNVNKMVKELEALIVQCEVKKEWIRVDCVKRYEDAIKEIEEREKGAKNRIEYLRHFPDPNVAIIPVEIPLAHLVTEHGGESSRSSKMSIKENENLFKVSMKELKAHVDSLKKYLYVDPVLEAIDFVKKWKTWKFWVCFPCGIRFLDWELYTKHLSHNHFWQIPCSVLRYFPVGVDDISVEIIANGQWKPVDIDAAIRILGRKLLFCSQAGEKVSSLSSTGDLEWPLCDDSARTEHLETVRGMLQSLLRCKCLLQYQVDHVIELAVDELRDTIPARLLVIGDLKNLKVLCFLGSSQFEYILKYLQDLSGIFISSENPEMENSMDEQDDDDQGFDYKEKVMLSEDSSFLLVNRSAVTSANNASGEDLSLSLFYIDQEINEELDWLSRDRRAKELLRVFEKEQSHLETMFKKSLKHADKMKAVREVSNSVEIHERGFTRLRKDLLLKFREIKDISGTRFLFPELKYQLGFVSQIVEMDKTENSYMFEYCNLLDGNLLGKVTEWNVQLSQNIYVDIALVKRSVDAMKQYSLQLGQVSAYDYQSIMLAVLKSFIQATNGIGLPLLPQKKAERTGDSNPDIGPSTSTNEPTPEVNTLGTRLRNEALDCLLNMIIQSLWHLKEFSEEFMDRSKSRHTHIRNSCVVCALKEIFESLGKRKAVAQASLRIALIDQYQAKSNSSGGQMDNASQLLPVILESLHDSLISNLKMEKETSLDCFLVDCFVHKIFGIEHQRRINCIQCEVESMHQKYISLYLSLSADSLRMKKNTNVEKSFDELLKLEMNRQVTCKVCGQENEIYHTLYCLPYVFTIVLVWENPNESSDGISRTLDALSNDLDLNILFQRCQFNHKYFLVSLVCCSGDGEHYNCFVYKQELEKYVEYNDTNEKVIGSWKEVVDTCIEGSWQPIILFFT